MSSIRLRYLVDIAPRQTKRPTAETPVTFAPMEALAGGAGGLDLTRAKPFADVASGSYNFFENGDVLLAKVTPCFENGKKALAHSLLNGMGFATSEVYVLRPKQGKMDGRFLIYLLSSNKFINNAIASMTGSGGLRRVNEKAIMDHRLAITNVADQKKIADFLDRKTARIDQLIEKKRSLTELLREKEISNLREAFQGIPRIKMKFVADIIAGQSPSGDDVKDHGDMPFLQGCAEFSAVSPMAKRFCDNPSKVAYAGDWLFSVRAPVGKINLADAEYGIGRGLAAIRSWQMTKSYLGFALRASAFELARESTGSTYEAVSSSDVGNLLIPCHPSNVQEAVARDLEKKTESMRELITKTTASIGKLKEYRSSVITAAVTGQIDVTTWKGGQDQADQPTSELDEVLA